MLVTAWTCSLQHLLDASRVACRAPKSEILDPTQEKLLQAAEVSDNLVERIKNKVEAADLKYSPATGTDSV